MTNYIYPPDPSEHWADHLAEKVSEDWARQHRLRWLWLQLKARWQGPPIKNELPPGEGHCPGLPGIELDHAESVRIRRAWLMHVALTRRRARVELINRAQEAKQQERQALLQRGIAPEDLHRMHRERATEERRSRRLRVFIWLVAWPFPSFRAGREMSSHWLAAPCWPPVLISVEDVTPWDEDEPGVLVDYDPVCRVNIWRQETSGERTLMSSRTMEPLEAVWLWAERRTRGWRLVSKHV
jgi:hypothetical protein